MKLNYIVTLVSDKKLTERVNEKYFRDKKKSRVIDLEELKDIRKAFRTYIKGNSLLDSNTDEIIAKIDDTDQNKGYFKTKWIRLETIPKVTNEDLIPLMTFENAEKILIKKALDKTKGHQNLAAKILGINPTTLANKMKKYKIAGKREMSMLREYISAALLNSESNYIWDFLDLSEEFKNSQQNNLITFLVDANCLLQESELVSNNVGKDLYLCQYENVDFGDNYKEKDKLTKLARSMKIVSKEELEEQLTKATT